MNAPTTLEPLFPAPQAEADQSTCFHCGERIALAHPPTLKYQGVQRAFCCTGCQTVADTIIEGGFEAYYQRREALADTAPQADAARYAQYDDPAFQQRFVEIHGNGEQEMVLAIAGMHCASCVYLAERAVGRLAGVVRFDVNMMTRRARLRWQPGALKLSAVLLALAGVGLPAEAYDQARRDTQVERERRQTLRQLFIAALGMMQVMMYVLPYYVSSDSIEPQFARLMQWACLLMTLPVVCYSGLPMLRGALRDLQQRRIGMDVPVALAIAVAFTASVWHTWVGRGEVYFDSITMFIFLLLCGRMLEAKARRKAVDALDDFLRLRPQQATRLAGDGTRQSVALDALHIGDRIEVGSSDMLPADGVLCTACAELDLSLLTGESLPVLREAGDKLPAGAVNCGAPIEVQVSSDSATNTLSVIGRLIDRAAADKPRIARLADRAANVFLALLLVFTALTTIAWLYIDPGRALPIAISLLVVSCPCALSLAMPAALAAATSGLAKRGVLVARADAIETLAQVDEIVFDKTGTLTLARSVLSDIVPLTDMSRDAVLQLAAALETGTSHPLGRAILTAAGKLPLPTVSKRRLQTGHGVEGVVDGQRYRIGRAAFVAPGASPATRPGVSSVALGNELGLIAWLHLAAPLRPGASELPAALGELGLNMRLLSGDQAAAVAAIANRLGLHSAEGDLAPAAKLAAVQALQAQGHCVAMVGDGINDAPVLSGANVSIALGDGTELAQISADIILMSSDLGAIPNAVRLARRSMTIIRQNLCWAMLYNLIAIPIAAAGWLTPWQSALGMSISSLVVVANALRLLDTPRKGKP